MYTTYVLQKYNRLIRNPYNVYTLIYSILNLFCIFKNTTFCLFNLRAPKAFIAQSFSILEIHTNFCILKII